MELSANYQSTSNSASSNQLIKQSSDQSIKWSDNQAVPKHMMSLITFINKRKSSSPIWKVHMSTNQHGCHDVSSQNDNICSFGWSAKSTMPESQQQQWKWWTNNENQSLCSYQLINNQLTIKQPTIDI